MPSGAARSHRAALAAIPCLVAACIPGALRFEASDGGPSATDSSPPDGEGDDGIAPPGDAGTDRVSMDASPDTSDGAPPVDAPVDSSDSAALPDGYIQCPGTSVQCQAGITGECCDAIFGTVASDGGYVYSLTMASCEMAGGPNCGSLSQVGATFTENFPQTCSTLADCMAGSLCCVAMTTGGGTLSIDLGKGISCQPTCVSPDRVICRTTGDCPTSLTCKPETDSILSHVYARYCQ
jgi:hypothetical protein